MNGLFLVDKPTDMTSFGVVARLRRLTGEKCGHSGTLDPLATGLLPVLVGKGTKLCELLTVGDKGYMGTLKFGICTDTGDITGKVLKEQKSAVTEEQLSALLPAFIGEIKQVPPTYSAIKVDGVPLYRHARAGRRVEIPERTVTIYGIRLRSFDFEKQEAVLEVDCSKGTYIRTLFADLAEAAGTVGTMSALRRTKAGRFSLENAVPLEALMKKLEEGTAEDLIPLPDVLSFLPAYEPPAFFATLLKNGCAVSVAKLKNAPESLCTVYADGQLVGLGERVEKDGETCLKVVTHL
ncbi:MAG: tRNA pseudouridine(55) synthase TruB [Clostridia bacterium]|nr:tRNA pseudouridine(55) synthase TruB [Clostridia bacterium]